MSFGRAPQLFIDEALRFYDTYLKGARSSLRDPRIEVQDATGRYRAERQYPPADGATYTSTLRGGSYVDDGNNNGTGAGAGTGIWTFSQPLPHPVWFAGEPVLDASVNASVPHANLVADVYDVTKDGHATLVSRGAMLVRDIGAQRLRLRMYPQDWRFEAGHRIGVLLSSSNSEWWVHVPTNTTVDVTKASIALPFLSHSRTRFLAGSAGPKLDSWLATGYLSVGKAAIASGSRTFKLPPR